MKTTPPSDWDDALRNQWRENAPQRALAEAVPDADVPEIGTRWRNRHTPSIVARVVKVMDRSPNWGLCYPLVEYVDESFDSPLYHGPGGHLPWWGLHEWHDAWERIEA